MEENMIIDIEQMLAESFADRMAPMEEESFISGDGTDKPLGLLYQAAVGCETQTAGTVSVEDILNLVFSVPEKYRRNGMLLMNEKTLLNLYKQCRASVNTVKSYCQRSGIKPVSKTSMPGKEACRQCGSLLQHTPGRKKKQFCSDACRLRWWHEHREMSRTAKGTKCAACGREFVTDRAQKYCSHACYIAARFGGAHGHETYLSAV